MKSTISEELESTAPDMPIAQIRAIAGAFLFSGDDVLKKCEVLSGGEKARVALAKLLLSPSNFLVLDEPTNHLDAESREVLLSALREYSGTLCLVSHDREFVSPLVDSILEIEPSSQGSQVIHSTLTYDEYLERKLKEASNSLSGLEDSKSDVKPAAMSSPPQESAQKQPSNNQKKAWQKEKEKVEATISELESLKSALQDQLSDSSTYDDKTKVMSLIQQQADTESRLEQSYARWEELSLLLEPLS